MLENIVQDLARELEVKAEGLEELLRSSLDFTELERTLKETVDRHLGEMLRVVLGGLLTDKGFLERLRVLGGKLGMRFKEYRTVRLRLASGLVIEVRAPYFLKAAPKGRRRRKRGPNGRGASLGLDVLGFVGRASAGLVGEVVQTALLCPSLAVAHEVLARRGLDLDVKTIRRYCRELGRRGATRRGEVSLTGDEVLEGGTLVIGIDGGRVRERRRKRGRRKAGAKRGGFHTDWKEPKLFTVYLLDAKGEVVKGFAPLHDATMQDHEGMFALLHQYLKALDPSRAARVVFCADGAPWIWSGVERLCQALGLEAERVHQVIDYTHAKQNLREIFELLPEQLRSHKPFQKQWAEWLWQGDVQALQLTIEMVLHGPDKQAALKKWANYFERNQARMQYGHFKQIGVPRGSGSVESAIRRVINLRLKAPGSFWTTAMAECFLFLRSQLLCGRWDVFLRNVTREFAQHLEKKPKTASVQQEHQLPEAA